MNGDLMVLNVQSAIPHGNVREEDLLENVTKIRGVGEVGLGVRLAVYADITRAR